MARGYSSRKSSNRKEYNILVLVCEGKKTERNYFKHFKARNNGLRIEIPNTTVTDPENLVKFALSQIPKYDLDLVHGDQIWCIFDVDTNTDESIQKTVSLAKDKIRLCISNPCFEIWYLLHFNYTDQRVSSSDLQSRLKKYIPEYNKTKDYFDFLLHNRETAIKNANKLNQSNMTKGIEMLSTKSNPSTQVVELVQQIQKVIKDNKALDNTKR